MRELGRQMSRRRFLTKSTVATGVAICGSGTAHGGAPASGKALIAITLDLEMSADYPRRGMREWNYEKGNLDEATKRYAVEAARVVAEHGAVIHFFCVGRVLEQSDVDWLKKLAAAGHPIGNHTYDHVNVKADRPEQTQFRFQRSPWLVAGQSATEIVRSNIRLTDVALKTRLGLAANGFRTPGGFANGLDDRPAIQQMLRELGFGWVSSKYPSHAAGRPEEEPGSDIYANIVKAQAAAQPYVYPSGLIEIPMSPISDVVAFRSQRWKLPYFLEAVRQGVQWAIEKRAVFDLLAHPSCLVVEDPKFETIRMICDMVRKSNDGAMIAGLHTIAKQVTQTAKEQR
jgi:peptidoglycan/xylan/chitin deacetylase (PgdA/CDA1 family)